MRNGRGVIQIYELHAIYIGIRSTIVKFSKINTTFPFWSHFQCLVSVRSKVNEMETAARLEQLMKSGPAGMYTNF